MAKGLKMATKMKPADPPKDKRFVGIYQPEGEDATLNDITQCTNKLFVAFLRVHSGEFGKSKQYKKTGQVKSERFGHNGDGLALCYRKDAIVTD